MLAKAFFTGAGVAGFCVAYAARCPIAQIWGRGFHRGPRGRRRIALTFDDGPSETTPAVLETLERYGIQATFFVCGRNVERLPELARETVGAGHEIGNHTYSHPLLLLRGPGQVRTEIERTQKAIEDSTGVRPHLFRPPYGVRSPSLPRVQRELSLTNVMWTVIGNDWKLRSSAIAHRVLRGADDGGIICLHDGNEVLQPAHRREMVRALPEMIEGLQDRGFHFATAGQMLDELNCEAADGKTAC